MKTVRVFAYGSLLNLSSLEKTIGTKKELVPAKISGFLRVFNVENTCAFDEDLQQYTAALNIDKSEYLEDYVNGALFHCTLEELESLNSREQGYELVQVEAKTYDGNYVKAFVYRVTHFEAVNFIEESPLQVKYLSCCLDGAKELGEEFYLDFIKTTFIESKSLKELGF